VVVATRERVGIDGREVWIDATAFREHMDHERFDEALELWRGERLAGLDDEWVYEYRDAHRELLSELLERMAAQAEASADLASAIARTRRRVELDPLAEDAQRGVDRPLGRRRRPPRRARRVRTTA
jgi:DNA-binding SARP family transcriptional activator